MKHNQPKIQARLYQKDIVIHMMNIPSYIVCSADQSSYSIVTKPFYVSFISGVQENGSRGFIPVLVCHKIPKLKPVLIAVTKVVHLNFK